MHVHVREYKHRKDKNVNEKDRGNRKKINNKEQKEIIYIKTNTNKLYKEWEAENSS